MAKDIRDIISKLLEGMSEKMESDLREEVLKGHVLITIQRAQEEDLDESLVNYEDVFKLKLPLKAMCRSGEHVVQMRASKTALPVAARILEVANRVTQKQLEKVTGEDGPEKCDNPECEACHGNA